MHGPGLKKWPVLWNVPPHVLCSALLSHSCWHARMAVALIVSHQHYLSGMLPVTHWLQAKVSDLLAQPAVTSTSSRTKVSLNIQINHENKARLHVGVNKTHGVFLSLASYFLFVILLETVSKTSFDVTHIHIFYVSCFHFPNMFIKKCSQGNGPCGRNFCFGGRIPELEVFASRMWKLKEITMTGARDLSQGVRRENLQSGHETVQAKAMNL